MHEREANSMTNIERVQTLLQSVGAPICDDCLTMRTDVQPRQQVNQICRQMADHGDIDREQGTCSICGKAKIVNSLISSRNLPD
jgi:hypothetical protein